MAEQQFKYLFTPFKIGPIEVRNRIMQTGHLTTFGDSDGCPTEAHAYYFAERAKGGCALSTWGWPVIHPSGKAQLQTIQAWDDKIIPGVKRITDMVHENGGRFIAQLGHGGRQNVSLFSKRALWSSYDVPCPASREVPKIMEKEDIKEMVEAHASAAVRMKEGGVDGVEIHSGYGGYFLSQFISTFANKRTDEYGGAFENRIRLVLEVLDAIRDAVGRDIAVGIAMNAEDFTPGGIPPEEYERLAKILEDTGKLDYITVKAGSWYSYHNIVPDMLNPLALWEEYDAAIKGAVSNLPIVAVGRINDPVIAERLLAEGHADMIAMTRANIADPEIANKAREGRLDDIRQCIACNQGCIDTIYKGAPMTCLQNPEVGLEKTMGMGKLSPAAKVKNVAVAGGGVAGMKAAEILARRGHKVTLYEKEEELGGQVALAARIGTREEFGGAARWLAGQIAKLGVDVRLGTEATASMILESKPDAVVVTTGGRSQRAGFRNIRPDLQPIPGFDLPNVVTDVELLKSNGSLLRGDRVALVDDGRTFQQLISVAMWLAEDLEKQVDVTTVTGFAGAELGGCSMPPAFSRLFSAGVTFHAFTGVSAYDGKDLTIFNVYTNEERQIPIDTVVTSFFMKADEGLYYDLKGKVPELYRAGDCEAPRRAIDAIRDADRIARII
ncbi:MAG: NAD(P)-binding protein [Actinobacteria bacterium]|nr:NAD(P)-binding protein [Actinomycetota bacterium]